MCFIFNVCVCVHVLTVPPETKGGHHIPHGFGVTGGCELEAESGCFRLVLCELVTDYSHPRIGYSFEKMPPSDCPIVKSIGDFFQLIDVEGPSTLWVVPHLGKWSWGWFEKVQ